MLQVDRGEVEAALPWLERAVTVSPGDPEYLNDLGVCLLAAGRAEEAMQQWYEAIGSGGQASAARLNLARALASGGFAVDARRHVREVLETEPGQVEALDLAAKLWAEAGLLEEMVDFHRRAWEAEPQKPERRLALARSLVAAGKPAAGIAEFRELVDHPALGAEAWQGIGLAWMDQGGALEASFAFREACKRDDASLEYRLDLIRALMAGNTGALKLEAERLLQVLLEQLPDHPELHFLAGCLYDDAGGDDLAIGHYLEALVQGCSHARLPLYLAQAYDRQGQREKAEALYRALAESAPEGSAEHAAALAALGGGRSP